MPRFYKKGPKVMNKNGRPKEDLVPNRRILNKFEVPKLYERAGAPYERPRALLNSRVTPF